MYLRLQTRIRSAFQEFLRARYQVSLPLLVEQPRRPEFGELAFPFCFELAKTLKRPPRQIAQEVVKAMPAIEGVERLEPAGGGYINVFFDRSAYLAGLVRGERDEPAAGEAKISLPFILIEAEDGAEPQAVRFRDPKVRFELVESDH